MHDFQFAEALGYDGAIAYLFQINKIVKEQRL